MSFISQDFVDGVSELLSESSPILGAGHRGIELDVENIPPAATNVNLRKIMMTVVGQDLCDGRKYALRHLLVEPPLGSVVNVLLPPS
ncbi:MAG: hypothetical protein ABSH29_14845 [Acidimicrobiales bacterium]|jgi:hypothetical protein